ncbi:MAG: hypothetical protein AB7C96_11455 [Hydrogenovibrio sp.]
MKSYFKYRCKLEDKQEHEDLVVFFPNKPEVDDIRTAVIEEDREKPVHGKVIVFTFEKFKSFTEALIKSGELNSKLQDISIDSNPLFFHIKEDGTVVNAKNGDLVESRQLILKGVIRIFESRKGLITSTDNFHFQKPSGGHCNQFIRASNLLVSNAEVNFLAIGLLPFIDDAVRRVYVDTSAISFLISVSLQIKNRHDVAIESFDSYKGLKSGYEIIEDKSSLIVISATTSGDLSEKIYNKYLGKICRERIVTVFHTLDLSNQKTIYNINSSLVGEIKTYKPEDCIFCKTGSKVIQISGEQFLPETPQSNKITIRKKHFTASRINFFKAIATKGSLGFQKESEHFFIDVAKVLKTDIKFSDDLDKQLNKLLSRDMKTIIHLEDEGSESLAKRIKEKDSDELTLLPWQGRLSEDSVTEGSVLVVAGVISSGRKLLAISRALRNVLDKKSTITYLVGFSKLPDSQAVKQLGDDLKQGGYEFKAIRTVSMPRFRENIKTAWDYELEFLKRHDDSDPLGDEESLPSLLKDRLNNLDPPNKNLFLNSPVGKELKLREGFAFWSSIEELDPLSASQADVYWTMSAILHDLRTDNQNLGSIYHTNLLNPVCFDRFNDGVIQACILRAALPIELNYSIDEDASLHMLGTLKDIILKWNSDQGEGALEFLMALVTKRLRLCTWHLDQLISDVQDEFNVLPDEIKFLIRKISN